jgi:predicted PurR-regulated permease PerM
VEIRGILQSWRVLALLALIGLIVYLLRFVLLPFTFAAALAYLAHPLDLWLRRRLRFPRIAAVLLTYCLVVTVMIGFGYWLVMSVAQDAAGIVAQIPQVIQKVIRETLGEQFQVFGRAVSAQELTDQILDVLMQALGAPRNVLDVAARLSESLAGILLTLVLLFYFLLNGPQLARNALWLVPPPDRGALAALAAQIYPVLGRYLRGVFLVVAITTVLSWFAIGWGLGLPHAAVLSLAIGLLEMIPVVGPVTAIVLVGIIAIQEGTVAMVIGAAVFLIALRLAIDQLIGPLILGQTVMLHPVVIIFSFLAGTVLFGMLGLLWAIPVAAAVRIVTADLYGEPIS